MNPLMMSLYSQGQTPDPELLQRQARKRQETWRRRLLWIMTTLTSLYYLWKGVWSTSNTLTFSVGGTTVTYDPLNPPSANVPSDTQLIQGALAQGAQNDKDRRWQAFMIPFLDGIVNEIVTWLGLSDLEEHFISRSKQFGAGGSLYGGGLAALQAGMWVSDPSENPPAVYQVDGDGRTLHWITSQPVAIRLRGANYDSTVVRMSLAGYPRGSTIS